MQQHFHKISLKHSYYDDPTTGKISLKTKVHEVMNASSECSWPHCAVGAASLFFVILKVSSNSPRLMGIACSRF